MQGYCVSMIFNYDSDELLMSVRGTEPYLGMMNLINGTMDGEDDGMEVAYRVLYEETGIHPSDLTLSHLLGLTYPLSNCYIEVYAGRLKRDLLIGGEGLTWVGLDQDFFDVTRFAGDGNIVHMLELVKMYKDQILA